MIGQIFKHPLLFSKLLMRRFRELPTKGLPRLRRYSEGFDARYGVDTEGLVRVVETDSPNACYGIRYQPAPERAVKWVFQNCAVRYEETTFVDVGCGKGRVLIIACSYPFKSIVGVEYSVGLLRICRSNLERVSLLGRCELVFKDAVEFTFPQENVLAFFYYPFRAPVLRRVLKNLANVRNSTIAYLGEGFETVEALGQYARIAASSYGRIYRGQHAPN